VDLVPWKAWTPTTAAAARRGASLLTGAVQAEELRGVTRLTRLLDEPGTLGLLDQ
jgi:hypothetical protein